MAGLVSGFLGAALSLATSKEAEFPYDIGDKLPIQPKDGLWTLRSGVKKADGSPVTIFTFECKNNVNSRWLPLAKNAFSKIRTVRHPDVLRFLDGIETETHIHIATPAVITLEQALQKQIEDEGMLSLGLFKIASVVKFLGEDCSLLHGNVRLSSIYVTDSGEWRLFGFELLGPSAEPFPASNGDIVNSYSKCVPPEISGSLGWDVAKNSPPGAIDSWMFGLLVHEIFNKDKFSVTNMQSSRGDIPPKLFSLIRPVLSPNPEARATLSKIIDAGSKSSGYFATEFIKASCFLENISIKGASEKEAFLSNLEQSLDKFPADFNKNKVLPELLNALEFGAGGTKVLGSVLKIGATISDEEFARRVTPTIAKMYAVQDRQMRLNLLAALPTYINRLSDKVIANEIFPQVSAGFTDSTPVLREATVKSLLLFSAKLSSKILSGEVLRHLSRLAADAEAGIRTNTIICLGMISKQFDETTRKNGLLPIFFAALRDTFVHSRNASLMALAATSDYYKINDCATKIIPAVSFSLVDPDRNVRDQAFKTIAIYLKRLEEHSKTMKDPVESTGKPIAAQESVVGAAVGWAGWAVTAFSKTSAPAGVIEPPSTAAPPSEVKQSSPAKTDVSTLKPSSSLTPQFDDDFNEGWDVDVDSDKSAPIPAQKYDPPKSKGRGMQLGGRAATSNVPSGWDIDLDDAPSTAKPVFPAKTISTSSVPRKVSSKSPIPANDGWDVDLDDTSPPNSQGSRVASARSHEASEDKLAAKKKRDEELAKKREERKQRLNELKKAKASQK